MFRRLRGDDEPRDRGNCKEKRKAKLAAAYGFFVGVDGPAYSHDILSHLRMRANKHGDLIQVKRRPNRDKDLEQCASGAVPIPPQFRRLRHHCSKA